MIRVKSTKNNMRMGSDNSINMEEIRQKVASSKKVNEVAKMSTPKSNIDKPDNQRVFSSGHIHDSA
jgi:hypothetical protein